MIIQDLLKASTRRLENSSDSPRLDAEVLLCHVLDRDRSYLISWPEKQLTANQLEAFEDLLQQRINGIPVAHLTGQREFWSLDLKVTPDTLIPRPDTETLVEQVLEHYPQTTGIRFADLGTGTGAIALAVASERPGWEIIATDQSSATLAVASANADKLGISNIRFKLGSWCEALGDELFDIIASNPPYIPETDPHLDQGDVRFEPRSALASGAQGLDDIEIILACSRTHLKPGGMVILEHGYDQRAVVHEIFTKYGFKQIQQHQDIAGNPRQKEWSRRP